MCTQDRAGLELRLIMGTRCCVPIAGRRCAPLPFTFSRAAGTNSASAMALGFMAAQSSITNGDFARSEAA